jgi:AcrR family transcriptional regulator
VTLEAATPAKWARRAKDLTRESWIGAAREALIAEGIAAVKVDRLANRLGVTRGGFYWRFTDHAELLAALLEDWRTTNTDPWLAVLGSRRPPAQRFQDLASLWMLEQVYRPDYDTAVRAWAAISPRVAVAVHAVDDRRIEALRELFADAGYPDTEALVRARITYFHQVGYYAMAIIEDRAVRRRLLPLYREVLAGDPPRPVGSAGPTS